ncbi:MAG TPA: cellulose binding domain-containing protein [Polyangiaceae bacterium]
MKNWYWAGFRKGAFALGVFSALSVAACSGAPPENVSSTSQPLGSYDLVSRYVASPEAARGWQIEWEIPTLLNPDTGVGVVGQWYNNLESGVYHTADGWFVYYYGDDNGLAGNEPSCDSQWLSGGMCSGVFGHLQPGRHLRFKYEFCTPAHVASVSGTQNCLYVDLEDGVGFRFLAEDTNVRPEGVEMYAHDIENFRTDGSVMPQVSCAAPTKMLGQKVRDASGTWRTLTGSNTWSFSSASPYEFRSQALGASPATWQSCSRITAAITLTSDWSTGYCANLTIANAGPGAVSSWASSLDLRDSTLQSSWSATFSGTGSQYTVAPLGWNTVIPANGTQSVGFCGNKTGPNYRPIIVDEDGS